MGIEKLYRDYRPMSSREIMQNNRSNLVGQPEFKIKEVEGENGEATFKLVKEPYTKYYLLNQNKKWNSYDECVDYYMTETKKYFDKVGEEQFLEENRHDHSIIYPQLLIEEKIKYIATEKGSKEWSISQIDLKIYKVKIMSDNEKEQITQIENQNGFSSWFEKFLMKLKE